MNDAAREKELEDALFDMHTAAACYLIAQTVDNETDLRKAMLVAKRLLKGDGSEQMGSCTECVHFNQTPSSPECAECSSDLSKCPHCGKALSNHYHARTANDLPDGQRKVITTVPEPSK